MKRAILTITFTLLTAVFCHAQQIDMKKSFFGYVYSQNGQRLSKPDLMNVLSSDQNAYELMKAARTNITFGSILEFSGGFLIGIPLGQSIRNDLNPNWALGGVGVGIAIVGTIFSVNGNRKAREAVSIYNSSLNSTSYKFDPEFNVIVNGRGIGLSMSF